MKKKILTTLSVLLFIFYSVAAQSFEWANNFHGNDAQTVAAIATDETGNVYAAVNFWNSLDANPGAGTLNFTSAGTNDIAIVKTTSDGSFVWGKQIGSSNFEGVKEIICDAENNIYIIGYFKGTLDFDPSPSTSNLISAGAEDAYLAKYDSDGNYLWAIHIGSVGAEESYEVVTTADNEIILVGYFQNTIDFDPSASTYNLTAIGGNSNFFLKLNADGTFIWATQIAYTFLNDFIVGDDSNLYFTGGFYGTIDFNPNAAINNLSATGFGQDSYIAKYDADGNYVWAKNLSGNGSEAGNVMYYDNGEDVIYTGGFFSETVDFNPAAGTANKTSLGLTDGYVAKYTADGTFIWVKTLGTSNYDYLYEVVLDESNLLHVASNFNGTIDLDPGADSYAVTSAGYDDIFFATWDTDGNFIETKIIGGTGSENISSFYIGADGAIFICGFFENTVDFDAGGDIFNLSTGFTGWDGFVTKYCNSYTINQDFTICAGDSIFAGGVWQYETGIYYDVFIPLEGCDSTIITNLDVITPTLDLGSDMEICTGEIIYLNAENDGATFLWNTGAISQDISVIETGTYSVEVIYPGGCNIFDSITITFFETPEVDLGADISACSDELILLDAENTGATFLWSTAQTTQTISVTESGNYSVQVTSTFGCVNSDLIHVEINPLPIVDLGADISACSDELILLDAENTGATFLWNTAQTTQTISVTESGNYSVQVTSTFGCVNTDLIHVEINPLPIVDLGTDISACSDELILLDAENTGATFLWNTAQTTQTISVTESGNYSVLVTNIFGCTQDDAIIIFVNDHPVVELGINAILCMDETIILDAENSGSTYNWNTGETTQTITVSTAGIYSVLVTNEAGCFQFDTIEVTNAIPIYPSIIINHSDTICFDASPISLNGSPSGGIFTGEGMIEAIFYPDVAGIGSHSIYYTFIDINGCVSADTLLLYVEVCNAINEVAFDRINIYPNPAQTYFILENNLQTSAQLYLIDVNGKLIFNIDLIKGNNKINLEMISSGIYIARMISDGKSRNIKIQIIQE